MITYLKKEPWKDQDLSGKRKGKSVCVQRYGGFGDMMQISSIFPGLKEQGFEVTVNTTPSGMEMLKHDPHIDNFFIQDNDQVLNAELGLYWDKLSKCFDKFIMLSESIEGALLAVPERRESAWHPVFRRMIMGTVDYLEATHAIADVPLPPRVRFYASEDEKAFAKKNRALLGLSSFVILWALSGSAVHKVWPHMDAVIARLLIGYQNIKIVTVGDGLCQVLESGWQKEKKVIRKSGKWDIRHTLAFAEECDLVIGPETGVMNAVSMLDMPKLLMLSHSGPSNIGKNWINTVVVEPEDTPCYPCHTLHRGFSYLCPQDERHGCATCAENISPDVISKHLYYLIEGIDSGNNIPSKMRKVS